VSGRIVVGTSSWADPGFVEHWYPEGLPSRERLPFYAQRFASVELNSSFYAVPARSTVERWAKVTPEGFRFDVKLHRLLSRHAAAPKDLPPDVREDVETTERGRVVLDRALEGELAERTVAAFEPLAEAGKLTCYLLQLSPAFDPREMEIEDLGPLIEALAPTPVAVELRNRLWTRFEDRFEHVLDFLSEAGAVFVCVDSPPGEHLPIMPPIDAVTSERLAYLRCHGRNTEGYMHGRTVAERFDYEYSKGEIGEIADRARELAEQAREVHAMFNNNARDLAPKAARLMREALGQDPGPAPR
jgi:uncharacterized protein YecE (DUF72 family)